MASQMLPPGTPPFPFPEWQSGWGLVEGGAPEMPQKGWRR